MHNFVPGPNFRLNLVSFFRETNVFVLYLLINEMIIGPLLAEGNRRIENHFFMSCCSLEACFVRQVLWCGVKHNCYKCCNWHFKIHSIEKSQTSFVRQVLWCGVCNLTIVTNAAIKFKQYNKVDRCLARYSPRRNRPTQLADQNIRISAICRPKLALSGPKMQILGQKFNSFGTM